MDFQTFLRPYAEYIARLALTMGRMHDTPPNSEIICGQTVGTKVVCGMILFFEKKAMLKI